MSEHIHDTIASTPASDVSWYEENGELIIRDTVRNEQIFDRELRLHRQIRVSLCVKQ